LALGAALAGGGLILLLHKTLTPDAKNTPAGFNAEGISLIAWLDQGAQAVSGWFQWLYGAAPWPVVAIGGSVVLGSLILGLARPAFTRILATAALGGAVCVAGVCIILGSFKTDLDLLAGNRGWVLLGIGGALAFIGLAYQGRSHMRSRKKTDEAVEAAPPAEKKPKKAQEK
jgi:hypothetical protein